MCDGNSANKMMLNIATVEWRERCVQLVTSVNTVGPGPISDHQPDQTVLRTARTVQTNLALSSLTLHLVWTWIPSQTPHKNSQHSLQ